LREGNRRNASRMALPPPVVPLNESALIDEAAVNLGQDLAVLMERAGEVLAREAQRMAPSGMILLLCGPGNNGGDGYVCARVLAEAGREVALWAILAPRSPLCEQQARRLPAAVARLTALPATPPALIIDAILGAGTRGRPREPIASVLVALKSLAVPILASDIPSGLGTDLVVPAALTVCLQVAKQELMRTRDAGEFSTVDIGVLPAAYQVVQSSCLRRFPPLKRSGHKGSHGELLIIGGGVFPGALEFACRAAVMTGCDMVRAWTAEGPKLPPGIIVHRQGGRALGPSDPGQLTPMLVRASAVLIGPGLGRDPGCEEAAQQALSLALELGVPVVVDADALAHCAEMLRSLPEGDSRLLLTPHRTEARNLIGSAATEEAIHRFARPDRVMLAKAPVDLISDGWRWQRNPRGNPRMAVGGTGDILAGLAGGLMARGATAFDAARMALLWETTAADGLWLTQGPCYDAEGVLASLPQALRAFLEPMGMWPPVVG